MSNTIIIKNREPQAISIRGGGEVLGITTVYVNGIDVTEGSVAYVIVPTKTSELTNDSGFINHEVDPTVPYYVKQITQADINSWNNKQDELVSGTNIKTINSNSLLGSGNIDISTSYSAGTGINISNENVISNTITSYNDLTDLPTIPTKTSELLNDSGYLVADDLSNVAFSGSYADLSDVPDLSEYATLDTEDLENYYTKRFMWNILPRTTGSGVSVSLSDTLNEAPIELSLAPSELSQETNLYQNGIEQGSIYNGSETSGDNRVRTIGYIEVVPNTNIAITFGGVEEYTANYYNSSKEYITASNWSASGTDISVIPNAYYMRLTFRNSDNSAITPSSVTNLQVGNVPNPNYPQEVHTISGENTIKVNNIQEADINLGDIEYCKIGNYEDKFIRNSGKNLFDSANANVLNLYINTSGEILTASNGKSIYIECEPSTTYTISRTAGARFRITDTSVIPANGVTGSQFVGTDTASKLVITTSANAKYLVVNYYTGNSDTLSEQAIRDSIMIQKGNIENPQYEPYGTNEWYIKKNIGKVMLDTLTFETATSSTSGYVRFRTTDLASVIAKVSSSSEVLPIMSNCYIAGSGDSSYNRTQCISAVASGNIFIYDTDYAQETLANFMTHLTSIGAYLYYPLANPTYTKITGTLAEQLENAYYNLTAYDNQTNISQTNNDLPFVISASTPKTLVNM